MYKINVRLLFKRPGRAFRNGVGLCRWNKRSLLLLINEILHHLVFSRPSVVIRDCVIRKRAVISLRTPNGQANLTLARHNADCSIVRQSFDNTSHCSNTKLQSLTAVFLIHMPKQFQLTEYIRPLFANRISIYTTNALPWHK